MYGSSIHWNSNRSFDSSYSDCENCKNNVCVSIVAVADFPSKFGTFKIIGFVNVNDKPNYPVVDFMCCISCDNEPGDISQYKMK